MTWWLKYLPIPFRDRGRSFRGVDCWGLDLLILEHERGQRVPEPVELYGDTDPRNGRELANFVRAELARWSPCEIEPFAVLLFEVANLPVHVGLSLGGSSFIHAQRGVGVRIADLRDSEAGEGRWGRRLIGAYRYG